jgi:hypothetical protein
MSYHDLSESTLTQEERVAEAVRITSRLIGSCADELTPKEQEFVAHMENADYVSTKQLYWLRDINDKY